MEYNRSRKKIPIGRVSDAEAFVVSKVYYRLLQAAFGHIISRTAALYFSTRKHPISLDGSLSPLPITMMAISTSYNLHPGLRVTNSQASIYQRRSYCRKGINITQNLSKVLDYKSIE